MQWKEDPKSVHVSWQVYFKNMESGEMPISQAFQPPPNLVPNMTGGVPRLSGSLGFDEDSDVTNHLKVQLLVRAYQSRGHHKANIDPLGIRTTSKGFGNIKPKELTLEHYQFTEQDLDKEFALGPGILPRFKREGREKMTLREIVAACEKIYCGSYGAEFIHIPDREKCDWLRERLEVPQPFKYTIDDHGSERIVAMMEERAGFRLQPARPFLFEHNGDRFGWVEGKNGLSHLTLSLPSGRIADTPGRPLLTGMREIAKVHQGEFRMTANQNVIVAGVPAAQRARIDALVAQHGLDLENRAPTAIARSAVACVALPTCALAMAEAERYCCACPAAPTAVRVPTWPRSPWSARRRAATTCSSAATIAASA